MNRRIMVLFMALCCGACTHINEEIIGYNEQGKTIVKVCKSVGDPLGHPNDYGSSCRIEERDYGRISNTATTINVISDNNR